MKPYLLRFTLIVVVIAAIALPAQACPATSAKHVFYENDGSALSCSELLDDFTDQAESLRASLDNPSHQQCGLRYSTEPSTVWKGFNSLDAFKWRIAGGSGGPPGYPTSGCLDSWKCHDILALAELATEMADWLTWAIDAGHVSSGSVSTIQADVAAYRAIASALGRRAAECGTQDVFEVSSGQATAEVRRSSTRRKALKPGESVGFVWDVSAQLLDKKGNKFRGVKKVKSAALIVDVIDHNGKRSSTKRRHVFTAADHEKKRSHSLRWSKRVVSGKTHVIERVLMVAKLADGTTFTKSVPVKVRLVPGTKTSKWTRFHLYRQRST